MTRHPPGLTQTAPLVPYMRCYRSTKGFRLEMTGAPRKREWQAAGLAQPFWNNGEPNEHCPIDAGRLRHVVELAADKAGWGRSLPAGEGLGIAAHRSFVSYVATVVHVKVDEEIGRASCRERVCQYV